MADQTSSIQQPAKGMITDATRFLSGEGSWRYMLNGNVEHYTHEGLPVPGNDQSNHLYCTFPDGYIVICNLFILPLRIVIYFLTNPTTGESSIGYAHTFRKTSFRGENRVLAADCEDCGGYEVIEGTPMEDQEQCPVDEYRELSNDVCLAFDKTDPIIAEWRITDCDLRVYWTDGERPRRYLYFDVVDGELKIQQQFYKVIAFDPVCNLPVYGTALECNALRVQPAYDKICLDVLDVISGGRCVEGTYQFFACWADVNGAPMSEYMQATAPIPIKSEYASERTDQVTDKGILILIEFDMQRTPFKYLNIAVARAVDSQISSYLATTIPINTKEYFYTDNLQTYTALSEDAFFRRPGYYDTAQGVTKSNDILFWTGMGEMPLANWQRLALLLRVYWVTTAIPVSELERNPELQARFKCYMRDEVYPLGVVIEFEGGQETDYVHLPGRPSKLSDFLDIHPADQIPEELTCEGEGSTINDRWRAFSTATVLDRPHKAYKACEEPAIWEMGEMGFHESTINYPDNEEIWGDLRCQPIRHHRMPDTSIASLYDGLDTINPYNYVNTVYPLGVMIDTNTFTQALAEAVRQGWVTPDLASRITGFRIVRGNRQGQESVKAKGLLYDVWQYKDKEKDIYYPNYPFNDLRPDPYISPVQDTYFNGDAMKDEWKNKYAQNNRFTFHSPDTHFRTPQGMNELKLETAVYGIAEGWFKQVRKVANFQIPGDEFGGIMSGLAGLGALTGLTSFEAVLAFLPMVNVFWQYQGVGVYNNFKIIEPGNKRRLITKFAYMGSYNYTISERISTGTEQSIFFNNYLRESSVFIKYDDDSVPLRPASDYQEDTSRYIISEVDNCDVKENSAKKETRVQKSICSYYAALKTIRPDQYGSIFDVDYLETSSCRIKVINQEAEKGGIIFGGDIHIGRFALKRKHSFFTLIPFNMPDNIDFDCRLYPNVGYPNYWMQHGPDVFDAEKDKKKGLTDLFYSEKNRFDCDISAWLYQQGVTYAYSYGIPYFVCESTINLACRRAEDNLERDFYPHQGDLDFWLQEENVPIARDNTYLYNKDYSRQNSLKKGRTQPVNYKPNLDCITIRPNLIIFTGSVGGSDNRAEFTDRWLQTLAADSHEFPLEWGRLIAAHGIEGDKVLVLFEHNMMVFNAFVTMDTSGDMAIISTGNMFASKPQEFSRTDVGYLGSQVNVFLSTEMGHITVDPLRGSIFLLKSGGQGVSDLTVGNHRWFTENLPFRMLRAFPNMRFSDMDNPYIRLGICLGYDFNFKRLFVTKHDYNVLNSSLKFDDGEFYFSKTHTVEVEKTRYICPEGYQLSTDNVCVKHDFTPAIIESPEGLRTVEVYVIILNPFFGTQGGMFLHSYHGESRWVFGGYRMGNGGSQLFMIEPDLWDKPNAGHNRGYDMTFGDQERPGFIGHMITGRAPVQFKIISEQFYLQGTTLYHMQDASDDFGRRYYQKFTFQVPPGEYVFRMAYHGTTIDNTNLGDTSTFTAGKIAVDGDFIPFGPVDYNSKELYIDVRTGDYNGFTDHGGSLLTIYDPSRPGERATVVTAGYFNEGINPLTNRQINPLSKLSIYSTAREDNYSTAFTDRNGFYLATSYNDDFRVTISGSRNCTGDVFAFIDPGIEDKIYYENFTMDADYIKASCNRKLITGRVLDCDGNGIAGVGVFISDGGDGITDSQGSFTIAVHPKLFGNTTFDGFLYATISCTTTLCGVATYTERIPITVELCSGDCIQNSQDVGDIVLDIKGMKFLGNCYYCADGTAPVLLDDGPYCMTTETVDSTPETYTETETYEERTTVSLDDCRYFEKVSWTASFKLDNPMLLGFHTWFPNYYNSLPTFFQIGLNAPRSDMLSSVWSHGIDNRSFQVYFGIRHPFMIDIPSKANLKQVMLGGIQYKAEYWRYHNDYDRYLRELHTFDHAVVFTETQVSGLMTLAIPNPDDLSVRYPRFDLLRDGLEVAANYTNGLWNLTTINDVVKSHKNGIPIMLLNKGNWQSYVNKAAVDIHRHSRDNRFVSENFTVRFINELKSNYKLLVHLVIFNTELV